MKQKYAYGVKIWVIGIFRWKNIILYFQLQDKLIEKAKPQIYIKINLQMINTGLRNRHLRLGYLSRLQDQRVTKQNQL
ncbi:hypothetical protein TTHERM_000105089 (macronuclear) [Tetrahymena thermophila SB210]|uniref:Uncharacterized protein n=1 Tax=Tetrahymena thermophila (strain SB210) TaxID=312017 RepID=W7XKZ8_TETTS|nr:hypothetical protein TTHERM_000105089 [Tetrahymena thermophila SB210]EWS75414.1 hypothetical protein TTHERM_000105089 [Tetrahymena thermophila SB210]|eukprot:XP_012652088.1 hypothetical protein TTHERM_000105089 [Tetrahymena thermophila SB210]